MAICNSCGNDMGDAKFCPACGASAPISSAPTPDTSPIIDPPPIYAEAGPVIDARPAGDASVSSNQSSTSLWFILSIVDTALMIICCCVPFASIPAGICGILGLVFSSKSKNATVQDEKDQNEKIAKIVSLVGLAIIVLGILYAIFRLVSGAADISSFTSIDNVLDW